MVHIFVSRFFKITLLIFFPLLTQGQETGKLLESYFNKIREGSFPAVPDQLTLPEHSGESLKAVTAYLHDTLPQVRSGAYSIIHLAGSHSGKPEIRQQAVKQLIEGGKDADAGNAGVVLRYLTAYRNADFSMAARDSIKNIVTRKPAHLEQWMRLAGFLELKELKETLRPYTQPGNPQGLRWAALVSLARMGDAEALNDLMQRVRKLKVSDDVVYKIFPDLVYTRQKEAIGYLVTQLKSDEKNCLTADVEREKPIPCGYRIMEQLAPVVQGYPLRLDASGDIKTGDYVAALETVRKWFAEHPDYVILRDSY